MSPAPSGHRDEQRGRDQRGRFLPGQSPPVGKPWRRGQSGNPAGRPRSVSRRLEALLRGDADLEGKLAELVSGRPLDQVLANVALEIAADPSVRARDRLAALAWITDRVDGPVALAVRARMESEAHRGERITIVHVDPSRGEPPMPAEVLKVEAAEQEAKRRAELRGPTSGRH